MPELVFFRRNEEVMSYRLDGEDSVRVGRGSENDIVFPAGETTISRYHFVIDRLHNQYHVRDLSGQGVQVNGEKTRHHALSEGDQILFGKWLATYQEQSRTVEHTIQQQHEATKPLISVQQQGQKGYLTYNFEGRTKQLELQPTTMLHIGKADDNTLCLPMPFISSYHCRIFEKKGHFFIKDLESTNGTKVNGVQVVEAELPSEATITLGEFQLQFTTTPSSLPTDNSLDHIQQTYGFEGIISQSTSMQRVFSFLQRSAQSDVPVLVDGESGTGKELAAKAIHQLSPRRDKPFLAINCGVISKELIESVLFGHEKGAFTGAYETRPGVFEQAQGGTIFLDEIGDLPLEQQVAFLRVLETNQFRRVGGFQDIYSDARIVAATHKNLQEEVRQGRFREDLMFRICVLRVPLPPLRKRKDDISLLIEYFTRKFAGYRDIHFSPAAIQTLEQYPWPGNIRELRNVVQRTLIMSESEHIQPQDLLFDHFGGQQPQLSAPTPQTFQQQPPLTNQPQAPATEVKSLQETEKQAIITALQATNQNMSQAARLLGIGRASLYAKMERLGLREKKS